MFESFLGVNPWTALFILLNTLTIYFVAKKFLFVPVMNIIAERQKEIDDMYSDAESEKAMAEKNLTLTYRGSENQRVIDMVKTRKSGEVVLYKSDYEDLW